MAPSEWVKNGQIILILILLSIWLLSNIFTGAFWPEKNCFFFFFLSSRSGVDKGLICFLQSLFGNSHFFEKAKLNALRSEMNCWSCLESLHLHPGILNVILSGKRLSLYFRSIHLAFCMTRRCIRRQKWEYVTSHQCTFISFSLSHTHTHMRAC